MLLSTMILACLYLRYDDGRIVRCWIQPDACLWEAKTIIENSPAIAHAFVSDRTVEGLWRWDAPTACAASGCYLAVPPNEAPWCENHRPRRPLRKAKR